MQVVEITAFGGPEVLQPAERPEPAPREGEVVVHIRAASINPTDLGSRAFGDRYMPDVKPPFVPGWDLAGEVNAVGAGANEFKIGDRVCGMIPFPQIKGRVGAYAEYAAVDPAWLAPLPDNVSFEDGATLPLNVLTAAQGLELLDLPHGARILITGASGGVGGFATSLALRTELYVYAVAGRGDEQWVRDLGVTEVLPRDANLGGLGPLDGVFDAVPVGPERSTRSLREGGTAVFTRPPQPDHDPRFRFETVHVRSDTEVLREMAKLLGKGVLRTRVARVLPLAEAAEGHRLVERGGLHGKVVLRP